jgi:hypothetical protein
MENEHEIWNWRSHWSLEAGLLQGAVSKLAKYGYSNGP